MKKNILCIESGSSGGGSAESLYQHIKSLSTYYNFKCVFSSRNKFSMKIENLGIDVYYSSENLFNIDYEKKHLFKSKFYNLFFKMSSQLNLFSFNNFLNNFFNREYYLFIEKVINLNKIDLIHTNNQPNRDFYLFIIAKKNNIKVVSHIRTFNNKFFIRKKANYCNQNISKFITYSEELAYHWQKSSLDISKISIIPNALEELPKNFVFKKGNILKEKNIYKIGLIGRIIPERGHLFAIDVLEKILQTHRNIKLYIIGDYKGFEKYYSNLKSFIKEKQLENEIVFTGFIDDIKEVIQDIDLLFCPYTIEPFGRVLLESWQLKTPVLLSNVGKINKIVTHNKDGLIFKLNNIDDAISCFEKIKNDQNFTNNIVLNAQKSYLKKYTLEVYKENMKKLYNSLGI